MECGCRDALNHINVRTHKVIRNWEVVGKYNMCGRCGRMEWLELDDKLEMELAEANHECIMARMNRLDCGLHG